MLPKYGKTRTRLNEWLEVVEEDVKISMELDSTEMMKHFVIAGSGSELRGGFQLPRRDRGRQTARRSRWRRNR